MTESASSYTHGSRRTTLIYSSLAHDPDYHELLQLFVATAPSKQHQLQTLLRACAYEQLAGVAHELKGCGGGYGFAELSELSAELERACKSQDAARISEHTKQVVDYLRRISV